MLTTENNAPRGRRDDEQEHGHNKQRDTDSGEGGTERWERRNPQTHQQGEEREPDRAAHELLGHCWLLFELGQAEDLGRQVRALTRPDSSGSR